MKLESDVIMWTLFQKLHDDLHEVSGRTCPKSLAEVREWDYKPTYSNPYRVKALAQLSGWLKRYRFSDDIFSDQELEQRTNDKFVHDQLRIGEFHPCTFRSKLVVQRARKIIKDILGPYSEEEIYPLCTFSRNAVAGLSGVVYLDEKVRPGAPISMTIAEGKWFSYYLSGDRLLTDAFWHPETAFTTKYVASLHQVNVPKNAKILRAVRPNTLVGSFRSIGLGRLIARRLKENAGLNIANLQSKHKLWAKRGSRTCRNVTADLSAASDSFTPALVNSLLPRDWYNALKLGRVPYVSLGSGEQKEVLYSPSFMAMGIGYTFPTMTLCFYALLSSLQQLSGIQGNISVFGDDLIYPRGLHPYVEILFTDLGFLLNSDKTFVKPPFRESCGGDYYDGVDVRPARPEGVSELLEGEYAISSYLYKLFNALIRRWSEVELPSTFSCIRQWLSMFDYCRVPNHFPDDSGVKDGTWRDFTTYEVDTGNRRKPFIQGRTVRALFSKTSLRPVGNMTIFYWEKLPEDASDPLLTYDSQSDRLVLSREVLVWRKKKRTNKEEKQGTMVEMVAFASRRGTLHYDLTKSVIA